MLQILASALIILFKVSYAHRLNSSRSAASNRRSFLKHHGQERYGGAKYALAKRLDAEEGVASSVQPRIAIGYINLPGDSVRSNCFMASIQKAGLGDYPIHKIDGVRLGNISSEWPSAPDCREAFEGLPKSYKFAYLNGKSMTPGQAGLFCAQFNAAKQLASNSDADYYLILEDDIVFDEDFAPWVKRFVAWQEPWDVAMLNTYGYPKEEDHARDFEDAKLYRLQLGSTKGTYYGTHAYLLRSSSADAWLSYLSSVEPAPFDMVLPNASFRKPIWKTPVAYSVQKGVVEQAKMEKEPWTEYCNPPYYTCHALSLPVRPNECCTSGQHLNGSLITSRIPEVL